MLHLRCSVFAAVICFPALAFAHYPWFLKGQPADKPGTVTMIFEEGPAPGNGEYLDPFIKSATYWLRTTEKNAPTPLEFKPHDKDGKRWLTFSPDAVPAHGIEGYCKWGVYQGKLLHYYVRYLNVTSPEHLAALARAEKLQFDLVPRIEQNEIVVQVLWEGKPAAEKPVHHGTAVPADGDGGRPGTDPLSTRKSRTLHAAQPVRSAGTGGYGRRNRVQGNAPDGHADTQPAGIRQCGTRQIEKLPAPDDPAARRQQGTQCTEIWTDPVPSGEVRALVLFEGDAASTPCVATARNSWVVQHAKSRGLTSSIIGTSRNRLQFSGDRICRSGGSDGQVPFLACHSSSSIA
jgi:hypothetical protein